MEHLGIEVSKKKRRPNTNPPLGCMNHRLLPKMKGTIFPVTITWLNLVTVDTKSCRQQVDSK